jgi:membrane AbrB-like protein
LALLAVGSAGGLAGHAIGLPAGIVVGSLVTSGLYRLSGGDGGPWRARYGQVGRLLIGTVVGAAVGPDVLAPLKATLLPMLVLIILIIAAGLGLGWALSRFTSLDIPTGLLGSSPGGLPVMIGIADEMGADTTVVTAIHFSRYMTVLLAVPALIPLLVASSGGTTNATVPLVGIEPVGPWRTVVTLAVGIVSGLLAQRRGVPTGDMIGPIIVVGGSNLLVAGPGPLALGFRQVAMLLLGTAVGGQMARESLQQLRQVALPLAAAIAALIGVGLLLGWGLAQVTPLDLATALLSGSPGGASTMPALAYDLGGDPRLVAALHLARSLVVMLLLPWVMDLLMHGKRRGRIAPQRRTSKG